MQTNRYRTAMRFRRLWTSMMTIIMYCILVSTTKQTVRVAALAAPKKLYRYFGYGSNVLPSTMRALRKIEVGEVTAAILPDYELKFSSAAFVRPVLLVNNTTNFDDADDSGNPADYNDDSERDDELSLRPVVHGLLYTLTEDEFAKVGQSEGVPFGYRWQSCQVYPYRGDGQQGGIECLKDPNSESVQAYTLVESRPPPGPQNQNEEGKPSNTQRRDIPPSASYLGLIREGARLWKFDRSYQDKLAAIEVATSKNFFLWGGWEGPALELAEKATGTKRTYMIDGYGNGYD